MAIRTRTTASAFVLGPTTALADVSGEYGGHHMWGDGWGWSAMGGGLMLLFWIALVVVIVLVVRAVTDRAGSGSTAADNALGILRERFAKGEIDQAEFDEKRKALGG